MKRILVGLVFGMWVVAAGAEETLDLYVGEIKILQVPEVKRVAVGNAKLLATSILNNGQLLVIGEGAGITSLHIWFTSGRERDMTVRVEAKSVEQAKMDTELVAKMAEVKALLSDVGGLNVRIVGERIVLSGKIDKSFEDNISTVKTAFKEVMDLTRKEEFLILPQNRMVLINMKVTEFNRSAGEQLGIDWDKTIQGFSGGYLKDFTNPSLFRITPGAVADTGQTGAIAAANPPLGTSFDRGYFGIATEITSRINFAVSNGDAIILSEPRLVARSGGEASFLVGGEIPFTVINSIGAASTEFKEFGISLNIKPQVDENDFIHANIETEVSSPGTVAPGDPPPINTRRTSADVSMLSGETLVLSGLIDQQSNKSIDKVALLGDIPVLGSLFRSTNFSENKSELVIFITPEVYSPQSTANQEMLDRQRRMVEDFQRTVEESRLEIVD